MARRDLEFFMANPGNVPADLDELHAALNSTVEDPPGEVVKEPASKQGEEGAASGAEAAGELSAETGETNGAAPAAQVEQVVMSKDGKHQIPYTVLQTEREQRKAAEMAAATLQAQVDSLTAQVAGKVAPKATEPDNTGLSETDLDQIAEDFPSTGKAIKALMSQVSSLQAKLDGVQVSEGNRAQREAATASSTAQEAIDANPTISYWQTQDPEMFGRAIQFDNQIKADPRNAGLSLDQRFAKVVGAVEAVYGQTDLPESFRPKSAPLPASAPAAQATAQSGKAAMNAAAKAKEVIDRASQAAPVIASLSDIPGGEGGPSDEMSAMANLSAHELGNKFMNMDPKKLAELLARAA